MRIASDARLHGHRTQNMFEALIVSLDSFKILKVEDTGRIHVKGNVKLPDFMLVLEDGRRWVVEVKNVFDKEVFRQSTRFQRQYIDALRAYANGVGCELKLAIYWAKWSIWTVISVDDLIDENGYLTTSMTEAVKTNEMAALGDAMISTVPPIRLRLLADQTKPGVLTEQGEAELTIVRAEVVCGERKISDDTDISIAWLFMQFGEWELSGPHPIMNGENVDALEFVWNPVEASSEGFDFIGSLSRIFARYFASETLRDGKVVQIDAKTVPEWFAPLVAYDSGHKRQLPIWKFVQAPSQR